MMKTCLCIWQMAAASLSLGAGIGIAIAALAVVSAALLALFLPHPLVLLLGGGRYSREKTAVGKTVYLPRPERDGYVFGGWYKDAALTKSAGMRFRMPAHRVTLYSKWIKIAEAAEEPFSLTAGSGAAGAKDPDRAKISGLQGPRLCASAKDGVKAPPVSMKEDRAENPSDLSEKEKEEIEQAAEEDRLAEEDADDVNEVGEGDEIDNALITLVSGGKVFVQYRRSFRARLIQASEETKAFYNTFRSEVLSYVGVKERVSWNYDSFNIGRGQLAKINANTKSLIVYLALDPAEVGEKYNFKDVSGKKRYASVPVRCKITGSRSLQHAIELLEQAAARFPLDFRRINDEQVIPYRTREELIREKLIKVYAKRETGETVTEEQLEDYIAEGATVEPMSAYTVTDEIAAGDAESLINDDTAKNLILLAESKEVKAEAGKRTFINLDTIAANYKEGETVDLASLKARGLIDKRAAAYKVLARGTLDKSLTVEAFDFSLPAVKMIVLTGGKVVRLKKI